MARLRETAGAALEPLLRELERRGELDLERVEPAVREVLASVRAGGDAAVREAVARFEHREVREVLVRDYGGEAALAGLTPEVRGALELAAARIRAYHEHQAAAGGGFVHVERGARLEGRVTAVRRAGVYTPGGKASYPSSVLMSALPARVAGVEQVIVATPQATPAVRAACALAGVDALVDAGGAQAIGALAYGTETVPRVDVIVGPGNLYVTAAKRLVFGEVSIDGLAGPSEILVVADAQADARLVAADLLSQAEHDEAAYPLLLTDTPQLVAAVERELDLQLETLPRRAIAEAALRANGHALVVADRDAAAAVADRLAVEHVALHVRDAAALATRIRRAGAIFVGAWTPEAAGDYVAGPSHVLPTGGAARFGAPLGVHHFVSRSSVIEYDEALLRAQGDAIEAFARVEGLEAHARAVAARIRRGG